MANRKTRHASLFAPWLTSETLDPPVVIDDTAYFAGTPEIELGVARIRAASARMPSRRHFLISLELPHTGIGYMVFRNGLTHAVVRTFGLERLHGIRQLQHLRPPTVRVNGARISLPNFSHTRYGHVHDVSAIGALIAARNGLTDREHTHLRVACLTHDALTPAGGDATKQLSFAAFDEDAEFPRLLHETSWDALRTKYRLDADLVTATVQNQGLLGALLDLADKIGYVGRDTGQFVARYSKIEDRSFFPPDFISILEMVEANPKICTAWEYVEVRGDRVGFTNPDRLAAFLRLRALMHRAVYWNPAARNHEFVLGLLVTQYLCKTGRLDRAALWRMSDLGLDGLIREETGVSLHVPTPSTDLIGFCGFQTHEAAEAEQEKLRNRGLELSVIEQAQGQLKPATHLPVWKDGKIVPFATVRPDLAIEIEKTMTLAAPFRLYWLTDRRVRPEFVAALRSHR